MSVIKRKIDVPDEIDTHIIVTVKSMGNIREISMSDSRNNRATIVPLSKDNFVVVSTGEVKSVQHHALDRTDNLRNLEKTMRNLSDLINTNVTPDNTDCCRFITFTYKENMQNSEQLYNDFKNFNKRFKRYMAKLGYRYEYIITIEAQERGAFHLHGIFIFNRKAPFIENKIIANMWGFGFVSVKSVDKNIDNIGKYLTAYLTDLPIDYKSIRESLSHAGTYNDHKVNITFINSEYLTEENVAEQLKGQDGIVICPGFGQRGIEGKIIAAHYTRTHDIPTFGICLGMQMMVIEFARNVLGYKDANSREMDEKTPHNVIDIMEEQKNISNMGGTMRLGAYECVLRQGSRAFNIYKKEHIQERHRHRYEFNNEFQKEFEKHGMMCVGRNPESDLVEVVEIPGLKWYIGTQYHPEYQSTVLKPHPLFVDFVKTAIANKK